MLLMVPVPLHKINDHPDDINSVSVLSVGAKMAPWSTVSVLGQTELNLNPGSNTARLGD